MIGKVLGNRYEIVEKIGGGGMALVYKAKCRLLNRYVAIKILRKEFTNDEEFITKFDRESQAAASLSHPNIVNVYDVGVEDNIYYIVMEYVKGKTLKDLIVQKKKLNIDESIEIAIQIADGLNHAHINGIIHRDVKPHNILITEDGRAKVTDFGIARAATSATVTNTNSVLGSVHYFSPEQARGGYTDEKSDIYSLGIVMYEMVTGKLPFQGDSPISVALKHVQENICSPKIINESIPRSFENIIMKCVKKDQSLRYNNARELLKDLKRCRDLDDNDFVDIDNNIDSPTIIIPAVKDGEIMSSKVSRMSNNSKNKRDKKDNKKNNKNNKKSSRFITIVAVFAALLLAAILAGGYFIIKINDYLTLEEVIVPDVRGSHVDEARSNIEKLGLKFEIRREEYSSEYEANHVISQEVRPGTKRKVDNPVYVVVSIGEKLVVVPNFENEYEPDIDIELEKANLKRGPDEYIYSDKIAKGIIISQSLEPSSEVPENSVITFVISSGPEISTVLMPSFIGSSFNEAKRDIVDLGLVVGEPEYRSNDEYPLDTVIDQSIPAGTEVEENEMVSLILSLGPEDNGSTDGSNTGDGSSVEKTMLLAISLPQNKEKVEVKVKKIQGLQSAVVYNQVHETKEGDIWVPVSGNGKITFKVFFDGAEFFQQVVDFEEGN